MPADDACDAYFLTRHHAHLLEALDQAVKQPASVSAIHGETGLGKSRLLRAFVEYRCRDRACRFIRFLPQGLARLETEDGDTPPTPQHELQAALHRATGSDAVWLVDQFELALPHGREQLYAAWQDAGRPALILAGQLSWPEGWRDLLPPQAGELHAAAVEPLDVDESRDYLDRLVCRQPGLGLRRIARLRRIVRDCRGRIPLLQDAAASLDRTECIAIDSGSSSGAARVAAVILLLSLLAYAGYYFWPAAESVVAGGARTATPVPATAPPSPPPEPLPQKPPVVAPETPQPPGSPERSASAEAGEAVRLPVAADESFEMPGPAPASTPEQSVDIFAEYAALPLLHERLVATRNWLLDERARGQWSIQLMTLKTGKEAGRALQNHLRRLSGRGVELDELWVYRSAVRPDSPGHVGLLYGRYASQEAAAQAARNLPPVLRVERPLLRSVASLRRNSEAVLGD